MCEFGGFKALKKKKTYSITLLFSLLLCRWYFHTRTQTRRSRPHANKLTGRNEISSGKHVLLLLRQFETESSVFCARLTDVQSFPGKKKKKKTSACHTRNYKCLHFPLCSPAPFCSVFQTRAVSNRPVYLTSPLIFFSPRFYLFNGRDLNLAPGHMTLVVVGVSSRCGLAAEPVAVIHRSVISLHDPPSLMLFFKGNDPFPWNLLLTNTPALSHGLLTLRQLYLYTGITHVLEALENKSRRISGK